MFYFVIVFFFITMVTGPSSSQSYIEQVKLYMLHKFVGLSLL